MENKNYPNPELTNYLKKFSVFLNNIMQNFIQSRYIHEGWNNISPIWIIEQLKKLTEELDENVSILSEMFIIPDVQDQEVRENIDKCLELTYILTNYLFMLSDNLIQVKRKHNLNLNDSDNSAVEIVYKQGINIKPYFTEDEEQDFSFENIQDEDKED